MTHVSERPLLSFTIPTYNRANCLDWLLGALLQQLNGESRVEVIVSDNASTDNTPAVVEDYKQRGHDIRYLRNETNRGADFNNLQCFEQARGEYVWIFGDDDVIVPGGLQEVLGCLESRRYDLLHIHSTGFQGQYQASAAPKLSHKTRVYANPQDFALHVGTGITFISGNIIRKAALERLPHDDFRKLLGTDLEHLSWTFALLRSNPQCACLLDNLVAGRQDNSGGFGFCQVYGTNLQAIVKEFFGLQSPVGRAILNRTIQCWFPETMLLSRRGRYRAYLSEDALLVLRNLYRDNLRYWFFLHPVLRLPLPLAEVWWLAMRVINRMDRLLGYPISR
jgi:glycosyltransferase involved in cell wall biosynthesis